MLVLENKIPKSYVSFDTDLVIRDNKKIPFYFHPNKERYITFNLPKGKFYTNNIITELPEFKPYGVYVPFNLQGIKPTEFEFNVGKNEHIATITPFKKEILLDKWLQKIKYKPAIIFLGCHEFFHLKNKGSIYNGTTLVYDAEQACDNDAENFMCSKLGYNPTQITIAKQILLKNGTRKYCNYNNNSRR